jgi:hypothetical protein
VKFLCWGLSSLHLAEVFSRELGRTDQTAEIIVQLNADARTADFTAVRCSAFVRALPFESADLRRELNKTKPNILVMDLWSALFSPKMADFVLGLKSIFAQNESGLEGVVFFGPSWQQLEKASLNNALNGSAKLLFETIWNLKSKIKVKLVTSPPVKETLLGLLKSEELCPVKRLGVFMIPEFCQKSVASLVTLNSLAKCLVNTVLNFDTFEKWTELQPDHSVSFKDFKRTWSCSWKTYFSLLSKKPKTTFESSCFDLSKFHSITAVEVAEVFCRLAFCIDFQSGQERKSLEASIFFADHSEIRKDLKSH